ncbi:MAG: DoxX family protein [Agriterribacter sp.]
MPQFVAGGESFANWGIVLLIATVIATIWWLTDKNKDRDFKILYYWLRVLLRFRLAVALLAYGFIKLFPMLAPYPSISNLNTSYGDFNLWKLFSLTLGIVPAYQSFLGFTEIMLALGLLYRKTASIAAFLIIIFAGNVFMSNLAYEGGEYVYCLFLLSMSFFILLFDLERIVQLLIFQKPTAPNYFKPVFNLRWQKYGRWTLKAGFILFFVIIYGFKTRNGYYYDNYQIPVTKGLPGSSGFYNVEEFILNKDTIAYSKTHPKRWSDVVFENWNTISIASNREVIIDSTNINRIYKENNNRIYELQGSAGRHYYSYEADSVNHILTLQNRNLNYKDETLVFRYENPNDSTFILAGIDQNKDSVFATLRRVDKKYLLKVIQKQKRGRKLKL